MYPDVNVFLQIFANPGEHDAKRMLLNMITTSLYLGLPLLWVSFRQLCVDLCPGSAMMHGRGIAAPQEN
jgi:hypothetical protein